jgi:hypothetical protein
MWIEDIYRQEGVMLSADKKFDLRLKAWGFISIFLPLFGWKIIKDPLWKKSSGLTMGENGFKNSVCSVIVGAPEQTENTSFPKTLSGPRDFDAPTPSKSEKEK